MQSVAKFNFLKIERGQTRPKENNPPKNYLMVSLLDDEQNQVKFFVFNNELYSKLSSSSFSLYEEVVGVLDVSYFRDTWNVNLKDLNRNNGK